MEGLSASSLEKRVVGINLNGAIVNLGRNRDIATLLKDLLPWLEVIHCFNHRLELALKDTFQDIKLFPIIDEILMKIIIFTRIGQKSKEEALPKLSRVEILLNHYGTYMAHIESLAKKIH